ncbi:MAG TPA: LOG family protein [Thermoanaerobaculia bacterium]|nr:LOG family protein [Thermoanaerobaculia bacterium]
MGVFGSSLPQEGSAAYEEARQIGREIARRGSRVVCGGYGGVMEAACRGASEAGGQSLGVLLAGRGEGNQWVSESVREPDLPARLRRLRDESNAWLFLPRGLGTMLEIVWMAESVVKGDVAPRPFVLLGDFWRPTLETALAEASNPAGAVALSQCIRFAATAAEAVRLAVTTP